MRIKVFIGYDSSQDYSDKFSDIVNPPYVVCKQSILNNVNREVEIIPIKIAALKELGLYYRKEDLSSTTEFTYSRFMVPYLSDYKGISIFCDSDFLWKCDILETLDYINDDFAVSCVHHDYTPSNNTKMDGKIQTTYPRKNWSSLMIFNNEHPLTKKLNVDLVNTETPQYLHRMQWAGEHIGKIPVEYNWLVGDYKIIDNPKALHYTNGGPWYNDYIKEYEKDWLDVLNSINER